MLLMIDNYDSFTYNIVQILANYDEITVWRPDEISYDDVLRLHPDKVIISPGPSSPDPDGISARIIREYDAPILGVCLGHQTIVAALGGTVAPTGTVFHGKSSAITHDGSTIYRAVPQGIRVGRYHSLVGIPPLPAELKVTSTTADGTIMGIEHCAKPLYGMQFHPESILTQFGERMLCNFLDVEPRAGSDHYIDCAV